MTRRGDPELINQAQRTGIFRRLVDGERMDELEVEHLIARWEGSSGYWDVGWHVPQG